MTEQFPPIPPPRPGNGPVCGLRSIFKRQDNMVGYVTWQYQSLPRPSACYISNCSARLWTLSYFILSTNLFKAFTSIIHIATIPLKPLSETQLTSRVSRDSCKISHCNILSPFPLLWRCGVATMKSPHLLLVSLILNTLNLMFLWQYLPIYLYSYSSFFMLSSSSL